MLSDRCGIGDQSFGILPRKRAIKMHPNLRAIPIELAVNAPRSLGGQHWQTRGGRDVRIPLLADEAPPVSLVVGLMKIRHQRLSSGRASTRTLPLATQSRSPGGPRRNSQRAVL